MPSSFPPRARRLARAAVLIAWSAGGMGAFAADAASPAPADPHPGFVVAWFLHSTFRLDGLVLKSGDTGALYALKQPIAGGLGLGGAVPDGNYELVGFDAKALEYDTGRMHWTAPAGVQRLSGYPPVHVEGGRLTDLGALETVMVGGGAYLVPLRPIETTQYVASVVQQMGPRLDDAQPLFWRVDALPAPYLKGSANDAFRRPPALGTLVSEWERDGTHRRISLAAGQAGSLAQWLQLAAWTRPMGSTTPFLPGDGSAWYGGGLGQVRVRDAGGQWRALETGAAGTVQAVQAEGARVLCALDDGELLASDDGGSSWQRRGAIQPGLVVHAIEHVGGQWFIVAAHQFTRPGNVVSADRVVVYAATSPDLHDLRVLRELPVDKPQFFALHVARLGDRLLVNASPALWSLDTARGDWQRVDTPGDVDDFQADAATGTLAAFRIAGMFSKAYLSSDAGASWKRIDHPSSVIRSIRFSDPAHGEAIRLAMGAVSGSLEHDRYDPARDAWERVEDLPPGCTTLLEGPAQAPFLCTTGDGSVFGPGEGRWRAEMVVD